MPEFQDEIHRVVKICDCTFPFKYLKLTRKYTRLFKILIAMTMA